MTRIIPGLSVLALVLVADFGLAQFPTLTRPREEKPDRATIESYPSYAVFGLPVVVKELGLTDEQVAKWKRIPDDVLAVYKDEIAKSDAEERAVAETLAADVAVREKDAEKRLDDMLTKYLTDDQKKRARQIALQIAGLAAFRDGAVETALRLTDDQKRVVNEVLDKPEVRAMAAEREKAFKQITQGLTAEQKTKWDELLGAPFAGRPRDASREPFRVSREPFQSATLQFWLDTNSLISAATSPFWVELGVANEKITGLKQDLRLLQRTNVPARRATPTRSLERARLTMKIQMDSKKAAEAVLTESQQTRLEQIRRQLQGPSAFASGPFLKAIGWTPEQNATVAAATARIDASATPAPVDGPRSPLGFPRFRDGVTPFLEFRTAVLAVLTPAQRAVAEAEFGPLLDRAQLDALVKGDRIAESRFQSATYSWSPAATWARMARSYRMAGAYADAKSAYQETLRLNPSERDAVVGYVTLLSACPDDAIRNGEAALEVALKQADADGRKSAELLDALAMAYAESGQFDDAVACQKQALARQKVEASTAPVRPTLRLLPLEEKRADNFEARLKAYEAKTPYRFKEPNRPAGVPAVNRKP